MASRSDTYCPGAMNIAGRDTFGGPFTAVDETGKTVTEKDIITGPTLLYFGYTFCPDVCPVDTARNGRIADLVRAQGIDLKPVFITVDPERDTPEVVAEFTSYIHDDMIGLTGSNEQIDALKKLYGAYGEKSDAGDPEYYLVDHTAFSYLVTPKGFVAAFGRESEDHTQFTEEVIAKNIMCHAGKGDLK